uniref:Uncharacterized protein n=1 Tax=Candidatus Kentrum sp. LPFa TaxID=2126335 RepID=A0A450XUB9_9GAMM|nr:MAG: hypothetical protein BECKLPF1236A_GA0070988_1003121 [Candidatus Kentron sp. LPFa]VFK32873.1 MAG: hypothetical protein BECKLPF1236C_GA0070990_1018410 [Candidatus Kentron sp. LPFa]
MNAVHFDPDARTQFLGISRINLFISRSALQMDLVLRAVY